MKSNGKKEAFKEQKLRRSLQRSGVKRSVIDEVIKEVKKQLFDGITTKRIFSIVKKELKKRDDCGQCRYNLRSALLRLGPAGYNFEKYIAAILQAYEYKAYVPQNDIRGACVMHEVDVIAKKDHANIFIEAKFRNRYSDDVDLKDTMATWARYLDLQEGGKLQFNEAWIMTNARFSDRSQAFGLCKGMKLIGWSIPKERPFAQLVDHTRLYPVTVLNLKKHEIEALSSQNIMLCNELATQLPKRIAGLIKRSEKSTKELISLCQELTA